MSITMPVPVEKPPVRHTVTKGRTLFVCVQPNCDGRRHYYQSFPR